MLDFASLETAVENIIQLLTALKHHVKGKHVEKDTGFNANLKTDANISKERHANFYILRRKEKTKI